MLCSFRVLSLWFENRELKKVNTLLERCLSEVPCHKFLNLVYQLSARLADISLDATKFQPVLQGCLQRMLCKHTHHTIHQLLALRNSTSDTQSISKAVAAKKIIDTVRHSSSKQAKLFESYDLICVSYIELASKRAPKKKMHVDLKSSQSKLISGHFHSIPVPTIEIPINPDSDYTHVICVSKFESRYQLVGGVNQPKLISCLGSDGKIYRQLVVSTELRIHIFRNQTTIFARIQFFPRFLQYAT